MDIQDVSNLAGDVLSYDDYVEFHNLLNSKKYTELRYLLFKYESDHRSSRLEDFVINLIMIDENADDR